MAQDGRYGTVGGSRVKKAIGATGTILPPLSRPRTIELYVAGLRTEENAAVARGYAMALGVLPRKLAGASRAVLEEVLDALKDAALGRHGPRSPPPDSDGGGAVNGGAKSGNSSSASSSSSSGGPGGEPDAETRRNAVRSLVSLCEEVGVGGHHGKVGLINGGTSGCGSGSGNGSGSGSGSGSSNQGQPPEGDGGSSVNPLPASNGLGEGGPAERGSGGGVDRGVSGGGGGWCPVGLTLGDVEGVLATLLAAAEDYSVDKRGDVGSWCRVDALTGMERLLRLASRASRGLPLANRGGDTSVQTQGQSSESFLLPSLQDRLALLDQPPAPVPSPHPCDQVYLTPSMMERVMCAVLKQLSEKLDSVRERAGTVLQKLVQSNGPQLPFVPERAAVKHAITHGTEGMKASVAGGGAAAAAAAGVESEEAVNWASPAATFPMVVGLLAVPEYHHAIVAGLVISVGGLSESVVNQSSKALLRWLRACKSARNLRAVSGLALRLVGLFGDAKGNPRIVVPLLKTLEFLLSNECFDSLSAEDHPFAELLLATVAGEMKGCRDVRKICLGASVFVCMLDYSDPARTKALRNSVLFLGHRFPNVRKTTAEALYLKLLANEDIVAEAVYDEALDILTCTAWDGDLPAAKTARSALAKLLQVVNVPASEKAAAGAGAGALGDAATPGGGNPRKADELESYESLVRTVGY